MISPGPGRAHWSLRRRIMVGAAAVIAGALLLTGAISVATVSASVTSVIDHQLEASTDALTHSIERLRSNPNMSSTDPKGFDKPMVDFVGHGSGSIIALMQDGEILDSAEFTGQDAVPLSQQVVDELTAAVTATPALESVMLTGLGEYRVSANTLDNGDIAIVGISLAVANDAVARNAILLLIVAVLGVALTIVGVLAVTRVALRPLNRMATTASAVADLPLEKGAVSISDAVQPFDTDSRTEVGRVGEAMQRMLDHVDHALSVRESTDRRMRRFITDASHELRTPLATILGYAELTRQENAHLPDLTEYSLARIEAEANRMSSLVSDLLLLARLDEGQDLRVDDVDLGELAINAVSDARASAPDHSWSVEVPDAPAIVRGDHERLHQVIANLLSNARVHTPEHTQVDVRVESRTHEGTPVVELSVTDAGPGIDEALIPELFDRFSRADESRSRREGSTGLGLAIVASIVELHEGRVEVESRPGRTEFRVRFPGQLSSPA